MSFYAPPHSNSNNIISTCWQPCLLPSNIFCNPQDSLWSTIHYWNYFIFQGTVAVSTSMSITRILLRTTLWVMLAYLSREAYVSTQFFIFVSRHTTDNSSPCDDFCRLSGGSRRDTSCWLSAIARRSCNTARYNGMCLAISRTAINKVMYAVTQPNCWTTLLGQANFRAFKKWCMITDAGKNILLSLLWLML